MKYNKHELKDLVQSECDIKAQKYMKVSKLKRNNKYQRNATIQACAIVFLVIIFILYTTMKGY